MSLRQLGNVKKVLFVASPGGHFVQMSLLASNFDSRVVVGTYDQCPTFLSVDRYYRIIDFSRDNPYLIFSVIKSALSILRCEKPSLVITTGAAPGLVFVLVAKMLGFKSLWIDSVANSRKLSMSGKLAAFFGVDVLTQWPELADGAKIKFQGRVV